LTWTLLQDQCHDELLLTVSSAPSLRNAMSFLSDLQQEGTRETKNFWWM
jgi:hypothetical protein